MVVVIGSQVANHIRIVRRKFHCLFHGRTGEREALRSRVIIVERKLGVHIGKLRPRHREARVEVDGRTQQCFRRAQGLVRFVDSRVAQ